MPCEWREVILEELAASEPNALATGPFGSAISSKHFTDHGVPVIRGSNLSADISKRLIDDEIVFLSHEKAKEFKRSIAKQGDLVFTCWGTINQVGFIDHHARFEEYIVSNKQMKLTVDPTKIEPLFLYYLFSGPEKQAEILDNGIGSSVPGFNLGQLRKHSVLLPPLAEQRKIVEVLGSLDDKITLLRETNAALEAIAQTIFKSWFVDFDPVRAKAEGREPEGVPPEVADLFPSEFEDSEMGVIPKGWQIQTVENLAERVGMGPFGSNIKVSTFVEEGVPVISGQHIRGTLLEDSTFNFITEEHAQRLSSSIVGEGDVVFTHAGNIGQVALVPKATKYQRYVLSQRQFFLRCNRALIPPTWMTYFFQSPGGQHLLLANASQVGVPSIARPVSYLKSIKLVVPPPQIAHAFDEITQALIARMVCGRSEVQSLTDLRDTLLPRLMCGKLRIPDLSLESV